MKKLSELKKEKNMKKLSELKTMKTGEMTGEEFAFFNRMTSSHKEKSEQNFVGMVFKGTKGFLLNAASSFANTAAETTLKDNLARLKDIKQEKEDIAKMKTDGDISPKKYNQRLAELEQEEEDLSDF